MMKFLCLFFPPVASLGKYNKEKSAFDYIRLYCINTVIINIMILLCVSYANSFEYKALLEDAFCANFAIEYMGLGLVFAIFLRIVESIININFKTEKKDVKKSNKSNN